MPESCRRLGCPRDAVARGLCNPCYRSLWRKAGGALKVAEPAPGPRVARTLPPGVELDTSWMDYGACVGINPAFFFPERGEPTRDAEEVCRGCVVREHCLEYAITKREDEGIWGGESARGRKRIRRARRQAGAA